MTVESGGHSCVPEAANGRSRCRKVLATARPGIQSAPSESLAVAPHIFNPAEPADARALAELRADGSVHRVHDTIHQQLVDLVKTRRPRCAQRLSSDDLELEIRHITQNVEPSFYGRWVLFPWSAQLVHLLPPREFHELRSNRNLLKITSAEQRTLAAQTVGIVGLSVGNAVGMTLALEGACGHFKLADFDTLELSNLNRVRASVCDLGLPKSVILARQIYELNPYAQITLFPEGLTETDMDEFLLGSPKLTVVVDECDDIRMKFRLRERAKELRLPVVMETSDRGMLDVERFDVEPERPLFHGRAGGLTSQDIPTQISDDEKARFVLPIVGADTLTTRAAASLLEVRRTLSTWPQLGADVMLGGATVTLALRRLALGQALPSGRYYFDLESQLDSAAVPPPSLSTRSGEEGPLESAHRSLETTRSAARTPVLPSLVAEVVEEAALAPSGGNCQPWCFEWDGKSLSCLWDRERAGNSLDVEGRASYLALGAALENLRIGAVHRHFQADFHYFPRVANRPDCIAKIQFEPAAADVNCPEAGLWHQIRRRSCQRQVGPRQPLPADLLSRLCSRFLGAPEVRLHLLNDQSALTELGAIAGDGDRIRMLNTHLHREMCTELRWTPREVQRTRDGLDVQTLGLTEAQTAALRLATRADVVQLLSLENLGGVLGEAARKAFSSASAAVLLSAPARDGRSILRFGSLLQRFWLTATELDLALHPWTALLYQWQLVDSQGARLFSSNERELLLALRSRFTSLFSLNKTELPLMLFRLNPAVPTSNRSLRRSLSSILSWTGTSEERSSVTERNAFGAVNCSDASTEK